MGSLRWRRAVGLAAACAALAPAAGAVAFTPPLTCRVGATVAGWQQVPIARFQPIQGVTSTDQVTAYDVAATRPQQVVATNGKRLKVSSLSGCAWDDGLVLGLQPDTNVTLTGTTSTIVSTAALPSGRILAAVREGSGPASRPHVVGSDNGRSGYRMDDGGLPPQGSPRLLEAADDGQTVYLVLAPTGGSSDNGGLPVPGVPDINSPTSGAKTGLLYASTDAGRTWSLRTSAGDLPSGGGGLDQLAIDRGNPSRLYAISNGLLLYSTDGGASFRRTRLGNDDVTAVETGPGGYLVAFTSGGVAAVSTDGVNFIRRQAPPGVTSAAYRGESRLAVEVNGRLAITDLGASTTTPVVGLSVTRGSLIGDVSQQSTFHALSGHSLLRYSDPPPVNSPDTPVAVGDLGVPAPPPGAITPRSRTVQLKVGTSTSLDYTLAVPKSPTPLDLMFLIDTSGSMTSLIDDVKQHAGRATQAIQRAGIDLRVGVATLGTGSQNAYDPNIDPTHPTAGGSKLYELLRGIGPIDAEFAAALARVQVQPSSNTASEEAQLIALEQVTAGLGLHDPRVPDNVPVYLVPPGQDAHWRPTPTVRRLIVHATDEAFASPAGTPMKNGKPDIDQGVALMNEYHVQQLGLSLGAVDARPDLAKVAAGTHTLAPPGGANCGPGLTLPAGQPLVCDTESDFSAVIGQLVRSFSDRQDVTLAARGSFSKVVAGLDASRLRAIDVTRPNTVPFRVDVTCKGSSPGSYTEDLTASLRGSRIATSHLTVQCLGPAAAARLLPPVAVAAALPAPPPPPVAPAAIVPAPPAAQPQPAPQGQAQAQAQMNPMTAAAMQRKEQLQLALALQAGTEVPAAEGETELAMVGQRRQDEPAALALLGMAMLASSALGLARLRRRPEPAVARAWPSRR